MSAQHTARPVSPSDNGERQRLCLGGSFDPIHVGHVVAARAAAESLGLPGVRLIPTAANPHKGGGPIARAADRLAMCRLAVEGDPFFVVDPIELDRPPPSYTIDTVAAVAGSARVRVPWLIGSDLLARLPSWHRFDDLLERVDFIVMRRAGHPIDRAGLDRRLMESIERAVTVPQVDVSATAIRERIRSGKSIESLVAPSVERFIRDHHLYAPV